MQITILAISNTNKPTAKGSYQELEVTYKDDQNKTGSRKIMSFVKESKAAYDVLVNASNGETYDVSMTKMPGRDGKDYWVWTNATRGQANAQGNSVPARTGSGQTSPGTRGSYETPEERAARQVYIVRQSSISSAVAVLGTGAKSPPKADEILKLAKQFEDFVFNGTTGDLVTDISALEDENLFQELPQ